MATTLNTQYGYSYDNLKVLLGGWNTWNENHTANPNAYPTDGDPNAVQQQPGTDVQLQQGNGTPIPLVGGSPVIINSNGAATAAPTPKP